MIFKLSEHKIKYLESSNICNSHQFYTADSNIHPYQKKLHYSVVIISVLKSNSNLGKQFLITVHLPYSSR